MAKFKSSAKTSSRRNAPADDTTSSAERLSAALAGSAQQVWLAGVGAFGRAQAEGNRLFEGLVREGATLEKTARSFAGQRAEVVKEVVETGVGQARERATDTWDRLEKVFEDRVQRALVALGVPGREDLQDLSARVETLTAELRRQGAGGQRARAASVPSAAGAASARGSAARSTATRAPSPSPVRKATARKSAVGKSAVGKTTVGKTAAARKAGSRSAAQPGTADRGAPTTR